MLEMMQFLVNKVEKRSKRRVDELIYFITINYARDFTRDILALLSALIKIFLTKAFYSMFNYQNSVSKYIFGSET
jgi:hypothetical protein